MTHDQVRTLFHEFGHVIHVMVGGQGRWHGISGIDLEGDVAKAPSTILEEWIGLFHFPFAGTRCLNSSNHCSTTTMLAGVAG
jgi:hypothetical protein